MQSDFGIRCTHMANGIFFHDAVPPKHCGNDEGSRITHIFLSGYADMFSDSLLHYTVVLMSHVSLIVSKQNVFLQTSECGVSETYFLTRLRTHFLVPRFTMFDITTWLSSKRSAHVVDFYMQFL